MSDEDKPVCKYGDKCYRKSADHLENFKHNISNKRQRDEDAKEGSPSKKVKIEDFFKKIEKPAVEKKKLEDFIVKNEKDAGAGESSRYVRNMEEDSEVAKISESESSDTEMHEEDSENILLDSETHEECIKRLFLVNMPPDFYNFWKYCESLDTHNPKDSLKKDLGLQLVGPYDILSGICKNKKRKRNTSFLRHWRYYYDPPEFLTVLKGDDKDLFHIGYFRDDPAEMPSFVASNSAKKSCIIAPRGRNIFGAVSWFIQEKMKTDKSKSLVTLHNSLEEWCKNNKYVLDLKTEDYMNRKEKVVCETFHKAGLVVPVDEETEVGYREVPETPGDLKKMLKKIVDSKSDEERDRKSDPLQELITLVQFANDECDYGEGIELGLDIFSFGGETLHPFVLSLLPVGYQLLQRNEFGEIIKAHLKDRRNSDDLSCIA